MSVLYFIFLMEKLAKKQLEYQNCFSEVSYSRQTEPLFQNFTGVFSSWIVTVLKNKRLVGKVMQGTENNQELIHSWTYESAMEVAQKCRQIIIQCACPESMSPQ